MSSRPADRLLASNPGPARPGISGRLLAAPLVLAVALGIAAGAAAQTAPGASTAPAPLPAPSLTPTDQTPSPVAAQPPAAGAPARPGPAATATPPRHGPVSPAARREAQRLGEKLNWGQEAGTILANVRAQLVLGLARLNQKKPEDIAHDVDEVLMPDFVSDRQALLDEIIDAWALAFTPEELKNLTAFYSTPLGVKLIKTVPSINRDILAASQVWANRVLAESKTKHAAEMEKRGLKF
jgi:hypothetical protein